MSDRLWCPECSTDGYHFKHSDDPPTCYECDGRLIEPPTRVKAIWVVKKAIAYALVAAFFIAVFVWPLVWAVMNIGEKPLFATRTVEKTVTMPYGIIPTLGPVVFIWLIAIIIIHGVSGGLPRA